MASLQSNISKGREVEFYERVRTNDPANSALIMMVLETGSASGLNGLADFDTFAAILAGGYIEVGNVGYGRKTLTDAVLSAWTPDDTNNRVALTLPIQTFATISAGDAWDLVIVGFDSDTTAGTDANIVPISASEIRYQGSAVVPAGDNILINYSNVWVYAT